MDTEAAIQENHRQQPSFESRVSSFGPAQLMRESLWRRTRYAELVTGKANPAYEREKQELASAISLLRRRNKELIQDREAPSLDSVADRLQEVEAKFHELEEQADEDSFYVQKGLEVRQGLLLERQRELQAAAGFSSSVGEGEQESPSGKVISLQAKASGQNVYSPPLESVPSNASSQKSVVKPLSETVKTPSAADAVESTPHRQPKLTESNPSTQLPMKPAQARNTYRHLPRPARLTLPSAESTRMMPRESFFSPDELDNTSTFTEDINNDLRAEKEDSHTFMVDAGIFSDFLGEQTRQAYENGEPQKLLGGRIYYQKGGDGLRMRISGDKLIVGGTYYYKTENRGREIFQNAHIKRSVFTVTPDGKLVPVGRSIVRNDWGVVTMKKDTPFDPNAFGDNLATFINQRIDPTWSVNGFEIIDGKLGIQTERKLDTPTIPIPKMGSWLLMPPHKEEMNERQEIVPIEQGRYLDRDGNEWVLEKIKTIKTKEKRIMLKNRRIIPIEVRLRKIGERNRLKAIRKMDYVDFLREINRPNENGDYTYIIPEEQPENRTRNAPDIQESMQESIRPVSPPPPENIPTGAKLRSSARHEDLSAPASMEKIITGPVIEVSSTDKNDDIPKKAAQILAHENAEICTLSLDTNTLEQFLVKETEISEDKEPNLLNDVISFTKCTLQVDGDTLRMSGDFSLNATVNMHIENAAFQINSQGDLVLVNEADIEETGKFKKNDIVDSERSQQMRIQAEYIFDTFGNSLASLLTKGMQAEGSPWKAKRFSLLNGRLGISADKAANPLQQSFDDGIRRPVTPRKQIGIGTQASFSSETRPPNQPFEATGAMLSPLKLEGAFSELSFPDSFSSDMKEVLRGERSDKHVFLVKPETFAEFLVRRTQRALETRNAKELLGENIAFNHLAMKLDADNLLMNGTFTTGDKEKEMLLDTIAFDISPDGRIESRTKPIIKSSENSDTKTSKVVPEVRFQYFGESLREFLNTILANEKWGVKGFQVINDELAIQMQRQ